MESIFIGDIEIRQTQDGLYCLNDFHKAAGGEKKHQVSDWTRTKQCRDYCKYLILFKAPKMVL